MDRTLGPVRGWVVLGGGEGMEVIRRVNMVDVLCVQI
jgi:hypothetical protein